MSGEEKILEVKNLKTYFFTNMGVVKAVDGGSFHLKKGQSLGIVGESGSGKSVTSLSILRLVPKPAGRIVEGKILYRGEDLVKKSQKEMRQYRGKKLFMISQDPMTSLNPVFNIGNQIGEAIRRRQNVKGNDLREKIIEMLKLVHIRSSENLIHAYPHQFSGGMKQRAMISMALACQPEILIADEPTTALDVTIQAQILKLMEEIRQKYNTSIILITHDLGVIAKFCEYILVMYAGKIVERADVKTLFKGNKHPYTRGLINSLPHLGKKQQRLSSIRGQPPDLLNLPAGCPFEPRCDYSIERCSHEYPPTESAGKGHLISCWRWREI
ncbi:MAG TPA: ABC transporter ATP-binding protein [Desulfobacteraceae bacterium]|nr:ABC transporter ATP-binding protein [Deltaproteobacteria bacterium]HDH88172.1 ABC transporter ATP-binding protein [Desulfobacteraceae bacterium]